MVASRSFERVIFHLSSVRSRRHPQSEMGVLVVFLISTNSLDRLSSFGDGLIQTIRSNSLPSLAKQLDCEEEEEDVVFVDVSTA